MVVCGSFAAFTYGFGTGSNDVANAFGTSVGAKTLTLRQAVLVAAVFEFVGAMVLGRVSTATIAGGIADIVAFQREPEFYAYGMLCALTIASVWQILSSYLSLNTSSTHSIIGCILGFAFVYAGSGGVLWYVPDPTSFPPYKGLVPIVVAWFFSPIFTAIASAIIFSFLKFTFLRRTWGWKASIWSLPVFVFGVFLCCIYFVFTKGAKKTIQGDDAGWTDQKSAWVAAAAAGGCAVVTACFMPFLQGYTERKFADPALEASNPEVAQQGWQARTIEPSYLIKNDGKPVDPEVLMVKEGLEKGDLEDGSHDMTLEEKAEAHKVARKLAKDAAYKALLAEDDTKVWYVKYARKAYRALMHGMDVDIHETIEDDPIVAKIHAKAEVFSPKVEFVFSYLQVFSACCVTFSHGAGEVGYMAGPLGTIVEVVNTGQLNKNVNPILWCVALGAVGLVIGLATYGYNIVRVVGVKLAKLSPTRGFCAEISTAFVILIAAQYGLPTSSSQVITGGIIGVGLCEGVIGVNWRFFAVQFAAWIGTLFVCAIGTAALFSAGAYAPCIQMGQQIIRYEDAVTNLTATIARGASTILTRYNATAIAGKSGSLTGAEIAKLASYLTKVSSAATTEIGLKTMTAAPANVINALYQVLSVLQNNTVMTIGQPTGWGPKPGALLCFNGTMNGTACASPILVPVLQRI